MYLYTIHFFNLTFNFNTVFIHMIINVHGNRNVAMSHNVLQNFYIHSRFCHSCASGMSKSVGRNMW